MRFYHLLAIAAMMTLPATIAAQDCSGADAPCLLDDGSYYLAIPDTPAVGLVMHLHGGGGTGRGMLKSGLAKAALARGYAVIAPKGEHPENRWSKDWSVRADGMTFDRDDVLFLKDVKADARARTGLHDAPLLLAGFSRGGSMVWDMACLEPSFADAYAPLAGAFWQNLPVRCAGPVRLFHTHGWSDRTVALEGRSFGEVIQGDVWASLFVLRATNGCKNRQPERNSFVGEHWYRHWTDCDAGEITVLLHKGGHGAPSAWGPTVLNWFEAGL